MANYTSSGQDRQRRDVGNDLANRRVLLVEDETLLPASILEMTLADSGCKVIGAFATARAALAELARSWPDAAVLDLNLNGETSLAVAARSPSGECRSSSSPATTGINCRRAIRKRRWSRSRIRAPSSAQARQRLLEQPR